jgi:hypothetical protein
MLKVAFHKLFPVILVLIVMSSACTSAASATPTASRTPATSTATVPPTATRYPTSTPNATATQQYNDFYTQVQDDLQKGYIGSADGYYAKIQDFSQEWPQMNWYEWWPIGRSAQDFVLSAHFKWSSASKTPEASGCGFVFALQSNDDHYAVFLDTTKIVFLQDRILYGRRAGYEVGITHGNWHVNIPGNPAEADFSLTVYGNLANVFVDNEFAAEYTLSQDSKMFGQVAYTLLSGTNKDYGTRCEMSNVKMWVIGK